MERIAIIGGGIVGATTAYYLDQLAQVQIDLYDDGVGQATKAASGIISPWLSKRRNQKWYHLAKAGAKLYPSLVNQAGIQANAYRQNGTIVTRKDPVKLAELFQLAQEKLTTTPEMGAVKMVDSDQIKELVPFVKSLEPGILVTGGAQIDGHEFVSQLLKTITRLNVINQRVTLTDQGHIVNNQGQVKVYDQVVIATGAWAKETVRPLGVNLNIRPQKGQLIELTTDYYLDNHQTPVVMPEGQRDIIPFKDNVVMIGATHENDEGFDLTPTDVIKTDLLASANEVIAEMAHFAISNLRVGTRAYTADFAPFFGHVPGYNNIYLASGLGSSGLTTGPMIGQLLAQMITNQLTTDIDEYTKPMTNYII